jgi:peptidoglycan/xylan/chitin deacetylase (PgdA/CDA1 family)
MAGTTAIAGLLRGLEPKERRLLVLIYHRVHARPDPMFPREATAEVFRWQMELLARFMEPIPLRDGVMRLGSGTLPRRAVAVTFDDGYADNRTVAAPILASLQVPATFFVATGYLGNGRMWNDTVIESVRGLPQGEHDFAEFGLGLRSVSGDESRRTLCRDLIGAIKHRAQPERQRLADRLATAVGKSVSDDLMMSEEQVRELVDLGFDVGAHTVSHPILRVLDIASAVREIRQGKEDLERITGRRVDLFAYPNGRPGDDYGPEHVAAVREQGFALAMSTRRGVCAPKADPWQLPRFTPWDRTPTRFLARMLLEYRNAPLP